MKYEDRDAIAESQQFQNDFFLLINAISKAKETKCQGKRNKKKIFEIKNKKTTHNTPILKLERLFELIYDIFLEDEDQTRLAYIIQIPIKNQTTLPIAGLA